MVNNGATQNFVGTRKATRLALKLSKNNSKLKVVNDQA